MHSTCLQRSLTGWLAAASVLRWRVGGLVPPSLAHKRIVNPKADQTGGGKYPGGGINYSLIVIMCTTQLIVSALWCPLYFRAWGHYVCNYWNVAFRAFITLGLGWGVFPLKIAPIRHPITLFLPLASCRIIQSPYTCLLTSLPLDWSSSLIFLHFLPPLSRFCLYDPH